MKCPKCNSKTTVIATMLAEPGVLRRRRRCLNAACGHRQNTEERYTATVPRVRPIEVDHAVRNREATARRKNEERALMRELGLDDDPDFA